MRTHPGLVFSVSEYQRRLNALRKEMESAGLRHLMVTEPDNLTYLTGHETSGYGTFQCLVISLDHQPFSLSRVLEESNFLTRTWLEETHTYEDGSDPVDPLLALLRKKNIQELGLELDGFFLSRRTERRLAESLKVRNGSGLIERGRVVKSDEEIALIQKAAQVTEAGMRAGIQVIRAGVGENEIAAEMHRATYQAGGEYPSVPPYITSGPRTIIGHATWTDRKLQNGECVFLELAGTLKRYHAAMMRTVFVGDQPPHEFKEAEKMVQDQLAELMDRMRPGVTPHEVDTCMRDPEAFEKIGATRVSRTGYSLGIGYAPGWDEGHLLSLVQGEKRPLQENMVFHLIPWLQLPRLGMVMSLSETVRVTPNGAKSFFELPVEVTYVKEAR